MSARKKTEEVADDRPATDSSISSSTGRTKDYKTERYASFLSGNS